jgi:pyrimidine-nucleoside phosphorylase
MNILELIDKKQHNVPLGKSEIGFFVEGVVDGSIPDYQVSAFLMAVYFSGMTREETVELTLAMRDSGEVYDLSEIRGFKVDKHSTGGVGDKTSMAVVPVVAACGGIVAKMSGRGLGHTGGTIDKLESIPGFKVELEKAEFINQVNEIGSSIIGAAPKIDPADKKLYALRDVTNTVQSLPLITSSIMSKKLASGADGIVLDVKCGSGAFMKTPRQAKELATLMIEIGRSAGKPTAAFITNMDIPLGHNIGNALEVSEVIDVLQGNGPEDLVNEVVEIAAKMLELSSLEHQLDYPVTEGDTPSERRGIEKEKVKQSLEDGSALEKFKQFVVAQGGNSAIVEDRNLLLGNPKTMDIVAKSSGYIFEMDTTGIGIASMELGAGRRTKDDKLDYQAGITIHKKTGDQIKVGDKLATLYANDETLFPIAANTYNNALTISETKPRKPTLIYDIL